MSQYPPPYSPPSFDYYQPAQPGTPDLLAPARRASIVMFVVGVLFLVCGGYIGIASSVLNMNQILEQQRPSLPPEAQGMFTPEILRAYFVGICIAAIIGAILMVGLGLLVRRGSFAGIVTALVLTILGLLCFLCPAVGTIPMFTRLPFQAGITLLILAVPLLLLGLQLVWLIQGASGVSRLRAWQRQYQAQYTQVQYPYGGFQQVAPSPQAYGYPTRPPVSPPPPGQPPVVPPPKQM